MPPRQDISSKRDVRVPRVVLADANVLYSSALRNIFLWLRVKEVISLHWTRQIDEEWIRNLAKNREAERNTFLHGVAAKMKLAAPDWEVSGFEDLIGTFVGVDVKDQHVAAAARKLSLDVWPGQQVALVTQNTTDFKQTAFEGTLVTRYSVSGFLSGLIRDAPEQVADACESARTMFKKPRESRRTFVNRLRDVHHCGHFAEQLANQWRLPNP